LTQKPTDIVIPPSNVWPARMAQVAAGLLLQTAVGVGGAAVGYLICEASPPTTPQFFRCLEGSAIGLLVGIVSGSYLGVQLTGRVFGRHANDGTVIAGSALGTLAGIVMVAVAGTAFAEMRNNDTSLQSARTMVIPLLILAATFPTVGALIAFEQSQAAAGPSNRPPLRIGVGALPLRGGAGFSLAGNF
jgi:hypothetical protein